MARVHALLVSSLTDSLLCPQWFELWRKHIKDAVEETVNVWLGARGAEDSD